MCMLSGEPCLTRCKNQEIIIKRSFLKRSDIQFAITTYYKPNYSFVKYGIKVEFTKDSIKSNVVDGIVHKYFDYKIDALDNHEIYVENPIKGINEYKSYLKGLGKYFLNKFEEKGYRFSKEFI